MSRPLLELARTETLLELARTETLLELACTETLVLMGEVLNILNTSS